MSKGEAELEIHLRAYGIEFEREYRFHQKRKWRFDFAIPEKMLAIEVEGLTRYGNNSDGSVKLGRHQTYSGALGDMEKYDEAMRLGWNIYRCCQPMIKSGKAIDTIRILLGQS